MRLAPSILAADLADLKGALADLLKQVPEDAYTALLGELSDPTRKSLEKAIKVTPKRFVFSGRRDKEFHLEASGTMAEEADAKQLIEGIEALRKQVLDFLKDPPPRAR